MDLLISAAQTHGISDRPGPGWIQVSDGVVAASGHGQPPGSVDLEFGEGILAPGLIDAQINGGYGTDFADAADDDWDRIVGALPATGVTAIAPTFITAPVPELAATVAAYAARYGSRLDQTGATRLLPCHVEGPFISEARKGAHRSECLVDPTPESIGSLIASGGSALGYVTMAPEREGAIEAIATLVSSGVRVAVGHSDADARTVAAAADAGATLVTHLFNAQRPLLHRDPGVVGAALADDRYTLGLIADLHHVDAEAIRLTFAAAADRVMLVTDAVAALGMPWGEYTLGGETIIVAEGQPATRADGTIAGVTVGLDVCIANAVSAGVPVAQALAAATSIPARALGQPHLGHLRPGAAADFTLLGPDFRALRTWIGGVEAG